MKSAHAFINDVDGAGGGVTHDETTPFTLKSSNATSPLEN